MGNHFHLLLETPQENLVTGMKWLLGTFSQGWNRIRQRRGHVFQGRYKSVPVNTSDADGYYFRIVADYIHLNPARAGLAGGKRGDLADYRWSSLGNYARGREPEWLETDRVLRAFELAESGQGRRAYVAWLEARAANPKGTIDEKAQAALRRGWYLGEEAFRDRLLSLVDRVAGKGPAAKRLVAEVARDHGQRDAERFATEGAAALGLPAAAAELAAVRKGDDRKALLAALIRRHTSASGEWLAARLQMGHPGSVSRLLGKVRNDPKLVRKLADLEKLLKCGD